MSQWFVYCPHCGSSSAARGPRQVGFNPKVSCAICNKKIDAKRGRFVELNNASVVKELDLQGVA